MSTIMAISSSSTCGRQPEAGDVRPHEAARARVLLEHHDLVAERHQIVGHRQRGGTGADAGDALAVLRRRRLGEPRADVTLEIGGHPLDAADGDRLLLDAHAAAGRLARAIAGAPENSREDVGVAVQQIGVVVTPLRDHADVLRHVGVRGTGPLAVDDLVKVVGVANVCRLHSDELTSRVIEETYEPAVQAFIGERGRIYAYGGANASGGQFAADGNTTAVQS